MKFLNEFIYRSRRGCTAEKLVCMGMQVGKNERLNNVLIDDVHAWFITIMVNVTLGQKVCYY